MKALARRYEAKRFSDAQLLAGTWWLLIVASEAVERISVHPGLGPLLLILAVAALSAAMFPPLLAAALRRAQRGLERPPPRTLLLLRVFGDTARTEALFDRIASRWRWFGPLTMIAAPDVVARTVDPGDFLQFASGELGASFVNTQDELEQRLATLDRAPDPDGRYRVNEFCCRDSSWQATVVQLIERADAVLMDLRGFNPQRMGCEFELRELAARLRGTQVVLVVDASTDRALLEATLGSSLAADHGRGAYAAVRAKPTRPSSRCCAAPPELSVQALHLHLLGHRDAGVAGGQREQDVGIPGAVQAQRLVLLAVAADHVHADRVHAEQLPGQLRVAVRAVAHHHRRAAGAAVRARIGEEVALALEAQAEGRRDHRLAHHRQVVQRVVEAERKADDQQRAADLDLLQRALQVRRREARSSTDRGSAARSSSITATSISPPVSRPWCHTLMPSRYSGTDSATDRVRFCASVCSSISMRSGKCRLGCVDHHVPAGDEEQAFVALEEEAARAGERLACRRRC